MTNKQILILFLIGAVLTILGALCKIMKWPLASLIIIVGMTFEGFAALMLVYRLSRKSNKKDSFLDS